MEMTSRDFRLCTLAVMFGIVMTAACGSEKPPVASPSGPRGVDIGRPSLITSGVSVAG
jgi:hypothetical protein